MGAAARRAAVEVYDWRVISSQLADEVLAAAARLVRATMPCRRGGREPRHTAPPRPCLTGRIRARVAPRLQTGIRGSSLAAGESTDQEGLEVALELPARDLHAVLVPLRALGLEEPLEDVLAERLADDLVAFELVERLPSVPGSCLICGSRCLASSKWYRFSSTGRAAQLALDAVQARPRAWRRRPGTGCRTGRGSAARCAWLSSCPVLICGMRISAERLMRAQLM